MIIDFQTEAAKRREMVRQPSRMPELRAAPRLFEKQPSASGPTWPTVDCGSGWYHADAMQSAGPTRPHND